MKPGNKLTPAPVVSLCGGGGVAKRSLWGRNLVRLSLALGLLGACSSVSAWEKKDVLEAIHQVENPRDLVKIGSRGELGPFQFRPAVWSKYTQKPFALAADTTEAWAVAEAHYDWIKKGLERNGLPVTPYHIGLVWNAGLHATVNDRASAHSKHYAERVSNLVEAGEPAKNTATTEPAKPPSG